MIWSSHRILTGITVFALSQNALAAMAAVSGSVFPDSLDLSLGLPHRQISHWFPMYLIPLLISAFFFTHGWYVHHTLDYLSIFQNFDLTTFFYFLVCNWMFWFLVGCLFHILEDVVTGYIPITSPSKSNFCPHRFFYTGSPKETFFVMFYSFCCFLLIGYRYFVFGVFLF